MLEGEPGNEANSPHSVCLLTVAVCMTGYSAYLSGAWLCFVVSLTVPAVVSLALGTSLPPGTQMYM